MKYLTYILLSLLPVLLLASVPGGAAAEGYIQLSRLMSGAGTHGFTGDIGKAEKLARQPAGVPIRVEIKPRDERRLTEEEAYRVAQDALLQRLGIWQGSERFVGGIRNVRCHRESQFIDAVVTPEGLHAFIDDAAVRSIAVMPIFQSAAD